MRHSIGRQLHLKPDPLGEPRNALAVFLLALCVFSGFSITLGGPASNAVSNALNDNVERAWGFLLGGGSLLTLVGMFWFWDPRDGLLAKRLGLFCVASAAYIFAGVIIVTVGPGGFLTAGVILGLAMAATHQWWKVEKRIRLIIENSP